MKVRLRFPHDDASQPFLEYELSEEAIATWTVQQLKSDLVRRHPDRFASASSSSSSSSSNNTSSLRLIWSGRILKDSDPLASFQWTEGTTLFTLLSAAPSTSRATPASTPSAPTSSAQAAAGVRSPTGNASTARRPNASALRSPRSSAPTDDPIASMMNSPIMQSMMSNPDIMQTIMRSNPRIQEMIERNPELGHILNDPELMRDTLHRARNPHLMQEHLRNNDLALSHLESLPGGFNALQRLYSEVQAPLMDATQFHEDEDGAHAASPAPAEGPLPNPWSPTGADPASSSTSPLSASAFPFGVGSRAAGSSRMPPMGDLLRMLQPRSHRDPNNNTDASSAFPGNPDSFQRMMARFARDVGAELPTNTDPSGTNDPMIPFLRLSELFATMPQQQQAQQQQQRLSQANDVPGFPAAGGVPDMAAMMQNMLSSLSGASSPFSLSPTTTARPPPSQSAASTTARAAQEPPAAAMTAEQRSALTTQFAEQLTSMEAMGFTDTDVNLRALQRSQGSVAIAIERLLNS